MAQIKKKVDDELSKGGQKEENNGERWREEEGGQ